MNQLPSSRTLAIASSSIISIRFLLYLWDLVRKYDDEKEEIIEEKNEENKDNNEKNKENNAEQKLEGITSELTLKNIIGCSNIQNEVKRYVEYLKNPEKFKNLNVNLGKGCTLVGSVGSGKRTIVLAVAGEAKVNLFEISDIIPDANNMFGYKLVCNGKKVDVQELFEVCRASTPCVVFINHIDFIFGTCRPTMLMFLHEMDKKNENEGIVFFAAASEELSSLEEKLISRSSNRFSHRIEFACPNFQERKEIFTFLLRDVKHDNTLDVDILARRTEGAEIGDIKKLLSTCMIRSITKNKPVISLQDVDDLIDEILTGRGEDKFQCEKESLKGTAYHEAGHALVVYYGDEKGFDPLYKVSIVKRRGALGITSFLPEGKHKDMTKQRMLRLIDRDFGGRAAEEILFGKDGITAGCASDLKHATLLADLMVKECSMSEKVGLRVYEKDDIGFSDDIRRKIESEIDSILHESYMRVMDLLSKHKAELDLISNALLLKKTLYGDDIRELIEESLSTASGDMMTKHNENETSPNIVLMRTFSKTATGYKHETA